MKITLPSGTQVELESLSEVQKTILDNDYENSGQNKRAEIISKVLSDTGLSINKEDVKYILALKLVDLSLVNSSVTEYDIIINNCGTNSVIGTLLVSPMGSTLMADGLRGLRTMLIEKNKKIRLFHEARDSEEINNQLKAMKLSSLTQTIVL